MNKTEHLQKTKQFITKVIKQRRTMLNNNYSKRPNNEYMHKTIAGIEYAIGNCTSFSEMMEYIAQEKVQYKIRSLINPRYKKWHEELDYLLYQGKVLQGRVVKQSQFLF